MRRLTTSPACSARSISRWTEGYGICSRSAREASDSSPSGSAGLGVPGALVGVDGLQAETGGVVAAGRDLDSAGADFLGESSDSQVEELHGLPGGEEA